MNSRAVVLALCSLLCQHIPDKRETVSRRATGIWIAQQADKWSQISSCHTKDTRGMEKGEDTAEVMVAVDGITTTTTTGVIVIIRTTGVIVIIVVITITEDRVPRARTEGTDPSQSSLQHIVVSSTTTRRR